ncbi:MAG TPA: bifunctional diguanylate cyclase/phosphodiesterase [Gammaproteobacteria bacterium]|nr:bifunctional diguanylate cyclase/phosphodiesterase [Gammaproteobacteria bacterium]
MACSPPRKDPNNSFPYIEPTIRHAAGVMITIIAVLLYFYEDYRLILLGCLLFISINLFQSYVTRFCIIERTLKALGFRCELDEIRTLNEKVLRSASIQNNYMETLNLLNEAVIEILPDGSILKASDGWLRFINQNPSDEPESRQSIIDFIHHSDKPQLLKTLKNITSSDEKVHHARFRLTGSDHKNPETEHWIGAKFMLEEQANDGPHIRGVLQDITEAYLQEKQVKHMATHDALTGLPNRVLLDQTMEYALAQARRNKNLLGVLFIDLDNFKQVNDKHGHKAGDNLLISVSRIMQQRLRESDMLARWGGDEFVIILPEISGPSDLKKVAESLMEKLQIELAEESFDNIVTLSIGGALFPENGDNAESLLVQADKALYAAKDRGRNNVQIYSELRDNIAGYDDFDITGRFTEIVKNGGIQVFYQPIVLSSNNEICGYEALARWHDEKHGWVSPGVFIAMAENLGLIHDLGHQILKQALEDFSSVSINNSLILSINLSSQQLTQTGFVSSLHTLIQSYGIKPQQLKFEVTESLALIDITRVKDTLQSLRNLGFWLSLDDFGTGYSSLSNLHNLPVHELKIDMSFVQRFNNKDGRIMLETIVNMGHSLDMKLVAEGIETQACVQAMTELGIEKLQGYYFGKPVPSDEAFG